MDIFISWSGPRSRAVAEALKEYLPMIVNAFNPWLSSADIDKGARWSSDLAAALATAKAGIICLTPNNLTAPYILFESGALSRTVEKPFVCTLLIAMEPSDVSGPLAQFQATKLTKEDLLQLLKTLNKALGKSALRDSQVETTFDLCWPKLKERLDSLPSDGPTGRPQRSDRDLLEELVDLSRAASADAMSLSDQVREVVQRLKLILPVALPTPEWPTAIDSAAHGKLMEAARLWPEDPEEAFSKFQRVAETLRRTTEDAREASEEIIAETGRRAGKTASSLQKSIAESAKGASLAPPDHREDDLVRHTC